VSASARRLAALLALCLVAVAACGNRLPESTLLALARGQQPGQTDGVTGAGAGGAGTGTVGATESATGGTDEPGVVGTSPGTGSGSESQAGTGSAVGSSATAPAAGGGGGNIAAGGSGIAGGGSAGVGTGTGAGSAQAPACNGTAPTITIGSVGELSGVFAPFLQPVVEGVAAWVAATNAAGGLDCHPLKYITADDGGDPSVDQTDVQRLVQQDHVIAFVGMVAPLAGNAAVSYLTQHQVPVIGSEGGSPWFYQSPVYFPQITSGDDALAGFMAAAAAIGKPEGKTKVASITCIEVALCSDLYGEDPGLAQHYGLDLVYRGQASLTQPDFTSDCQAAQQDGAQLLLAGMDTNSIERILNDCASIGYHPLVFTGGPLATPGLAQDSQAEGLVDVSYNVPFIQTSNPQVAAMQSAIRQYVPGVPPSTGTMAGWVAGELLAAAAQHLSDPPAAQNLLQGLWTLRSDDLNGTTEPLTFQQGQDATPQICFWTLQIHGGAFVPIGSPNRVCG
jgi:branched-chain amino acid transport system substrate-binding protein